MYKIYALDCGNGTVYAFDSSFYVKNPSSIYVEIGQSEDKDAHKAYKAVDDHGLYNYEIKGGKLAERDKTEDIKRLESEELNARYIPEYDQSLAEVLNKLLPQMQLTENEKIQISGVYADWALGNFAVGDVRNHAGQTWECYTAHDNAQYPDITPDNPQTWANFWRPLHGKSKETARPWVQPWAGTTDIYHAGEYMVYTDGKIYKCRSDTNFSPDEYAGAWEVA